MSKKHAGYGLRRVSYSACSLIALLTLASATAQAAPVATPLAALTIEDMFVHAHFIVKAVMIFLGLCSVLTFTLLIEKQLHFSATRRANTAFQENFRKNAVLAARLALADTNSLMGRMWQGAKGEYQQFMAMHPDNQYTPHQADRFLQRVALTVGVVQENELARLGRSMGILATIGSTAPFIGLLGTVWGILHSFAQIAATQTSSLTVVAPGIAEALLATAIGLFAAIPAVMIYNKFVRDMNGFVGALDNFASEMVTSLSRELDRVG